MLDRIIDSHVHLRLLAKYNPDRIDWLIEHHCAVISWAFGGNIGSVSDFTDYLTDRHSGFEVLRRCGLDCYYLCGIHPRKIPPDLRPESVSDILSPFLEAPECLGIGEIGLETGTAREREILCSQIEFGLSSGLSHIRFGIHTPRRHKETVTRQLLTLLGAYESLASMSVIDHCSPEIIEDVLAKGYHAGISLSPNKSSENECMGMLKRFGSKAHRIMCNTDSSRDFYEDLVLAARSGNIDTDLAEKIFFSTAADFFGIKDHY